MADELPPAEVASLAARFGFEADFALADSLRRALRHYSRYLAGKEDRRAWEGRAREHAKRIHGAALELAELMRSADPYGITYAAVHGFPTDPEFWSRLGASAGDLAAQPAPGRGGAEDVGLNLLISELGRIFEAGTGHPATVTISPDGSDDAGRAVDFICAVLGVARVMHPSRLAIGRRLLRQREG